MKPNPHRDLCTAIVQIVRAAVLLAAAGTLLQPLPIAAAAAPKPNIVVILVDDMGFSDIGCYGSEIPTPNLDKLAAGGLRFTQFYNTGRCCPTRASILTGLYSASDRRGAHDRRRRRAGLSRAAQRPLCDARRGAGRGGLLHGHERQMARGAGAWRRALGTRLPAQPQLSEGRLLLSRGQAKSGSSSMARRWPMMRRSCRRTGTPPTFIPTSAFGSLTRRSPPKSPSCSTWPITRRISRCRRPRTRSPSSAANTRSAGTSSASNATPGRRNSAWWTSPGRSRPARPRCRRGTR